MLYQIVSFLLDVAGGLLTGACLLRLYMQRQRVPFGNPVGRLVFALTDWLVLPLRRAIPAARGIDWASLIAALLIQLVQYVILWLVLGAGDGWAWLPWLAFFGLLRVAVSAVMGVVIIHAVMSWVQARSPVSDVLDRLAAPILRPVRKLLPPLGGVDLSPLVVLVLLQVLLMVLAHLQISLWR
ncbi:MAG: YggT family protein [Giesbergeria sp.]